MSIASRPDDVDEGVGEVTQAGETRKTPDRARVACRPAQREDGEERCNPD